MNAANSPPRLGSTPSYAELISRTSVGLVILVAHVVLVYMLRGAFSDHRGLENSATFPFVVRIIDTPRPTVSLNILPPAISRIDLPLAIPAAEIDATPDSGTSRFAPAKLDSSRPVAKFAAAQIGARHASSTITLLVEILEDGSVGQIEIKASAGAELDAAAKSYVRRLHWTPANVGGKPAAMKVLYSLAL